MKTTLLVWAVLVWAAHAPAASIHTTDADFLTGSGDGNVDIGAGDGDGSVRLAKLAGSLGPWVAKTSLPSPRMGVLAWAWGSRIYIASGHGSAVTNTVHSADIDGSGNLSAWTLRGGFPSTYSPIGVARWADRLYAAGGVNTPLYSDQVLMASLGPDGTPGPWVNVTALPFPDYGARILAEKGWLYYFSANPNGGAGSNAVYAAPIRGDGSLGSWTLRPSRSQALFFFSVAASMGSLFVIGGERSNFAGEVGVDRSVPADDGSTSAWAFQAALPAPRSWNSSSPVGFAGKLWHVGGKTSSSTIHHQTYASTLGAGGIPAAWSTESGLPAGVSRAAGTLVAAAGRLWHLGGYNPSLDVTDTVYAADLNAGSVNAAQGVYVNRFDLGSDQALTTLEFDVSPAGSASLQVRSALAGGVFGGWTAATSASPVSLTWTARYLEYRILLNDSVGQTVQLERVELSIATPTVSPTPPPTSTASPSFTPSSTPTTTPTASPSLTPSPTPTTTPTASPSSTPGPTATITLTPGQLTPMPPSSGGDGDAKAFPNPVKGARVHFAFDMAENGEALIYVWTSAGHLASKVNDSFGPGRKILSVNVKDYAPGVYLYQLVINYDSGWIVNGPVKRFAVLP